VGQTRLADNTNREQAQHLQLGASNTGRGEEMSRTIWFILGIIGLIVVVAWVVNNI
jgi:hypothetical protein